ncbi:MAG: glycosyltransferase, partial [Phycisphaerae bacterium]|nr:glycosyltransferase [Phycisphaerae bacterium]NIR47956.1 glycosyltransferase [candidate division KSB1 bacterium]NIS45156.1 glycosyltransferase [candidate division Zixibacteria bacterium]NIU13316.1 glycosyltransferase [candidate division Zixibacteria bacterium]NIV00398.1 glycosyltransferase [Phycisphaerae bacterium]
MDENNNSKTNYSISIVIPCYNEIKTIESIIKKVKKATINYDREILVVDDYSTDGTRD